MKWHTRKPVHQRSHNEVLVLFEVSWLSHEDVWGVNRFSTSLVYFYYESLRHQFLLFQAVLGILTPASRSSSGFWRDRLISKIQRPNSDFLKYSWAQRTATRSCIWSYIRWGTVHVVGHDTTSSFILVCVYSFSRRIFIIFDLYFTALSNDIHFLGIKRLHFLRWSTSHVAHHHIKCHF